MNTMDNSQHAGRASLERKVRVVINMTDYPINLPLEPAMWECWVVGKLKEAGVPVKGALVFGGLESGTLTRFDDPTDFGATVWEWNPNEANNEESK